MPKKMSDFDRGVIVGVGLACSIISSDHDRPTIVAIAACGLDRRKMKAAGVPDYDLDKLKSVFRELA